MAEPTVQVVYGYVLGFQPNTVIGLERDGAWLVPGGPVEGVGAPTGIGPANLEYDGDPVRSAALAWHVKQQTGLTLARLSRPFQVKIYDIPNAKAISMLYLAVASGEQIGGKVVVAGAIPQFAAETGINPEQVRRFLAGKDPVLPPSLWQRIRAWFGAKT
jgi:hypothetical protein